MKKKTWVVVLLSIIPGLSQLYLGFAKRAAVYLMVSIAAVIGMIGMFSLNIFWYLEGTIQALIMIILFVFWIVAALDAFRLRDRLAAQQAYNEAGPGIPGKTDVPGTVIPGKTTASDRKMITMVLSIVPGAGHMFIGLMKKGLILMSLFFFMIFFMGWLHMSLFLFIIPVIWFYSFFDAFHFMKAEGSYKDVFNKEDFKMTFFNIKHKWIGWGLIGAGLLVVLQRIVFPLMTWQMQRHSQTSIVALILIGGGIKMLMKKKDEEKEELERWQKDE